VHDLRNPLFAVFAYADLLKNAAAQPDPDQKRSGQLFAAMQQAVTRMQDILSETMFVVRSRMRRLPLSPSAFDLRDFCQLLLADGDPGGRLRFRCGDGPFPVTADAPRLRHALENLLSNALKYSDGPVVVSLTRAAQKYRIEVSDKGIGIPVQDQAGIFEPFFRASNTGGKPGHGLGLCVVQSCVQEQGGSVSFVSQPNQGATFTIELPQPLPIPAAFEPPAAAPRQKWPEPQPPGARPEAAPSKSVSEKAGALRAVIVEDDPVVCNVLRELLENSHDAQVLGAAATVAQARLLISQQKPAVLFLDVNLPDGSGFDLLPDLDPGVSVVFVTSAEEYAAQAFDCQATDYLVKPVSSERLRTALRRVRQRLSAKPADAALADSRLTGSFLVKTLSEKRLVKVSEIKSIIAYGEYSWVYWDKSQKGALLRKSLKRWLSELPGGQFVRVHRRAIINLAFLDRLEKPRGGRLQVRLRDTAEPITVSLRLAPVLNRKLKALRG
jgi:two-component system LytT family response regulator